MTKPEQPKGERRRNTPDETRRAAKKATETAQALADALVWTGDETQGYLAQGEAVIYTILNDSPDGKYEVRVIYNVVDPADLIPGSKTTKRLTNLHGQRIADPTIPGNTVWYAKPTATLDEAKILAQMDYDKRRPGRS